jgi:spore maturation protein CgeB
MDGGLVMAWVKIYQDTEKLIERDTATDAERVTYSNVNYQTIRTQAANALEANRTFVALGTAATAVQVRNQTMALSRQVNGIIRILLDQLDGTD